MKIFKLVSVFIFVVGCHSPKELSIAEKENYLHLGDSISNKAQSVLLANVSQQIQENGVVEAVDFCHEKAIFLTDEISDEYSTKIQRLSNKNRNPNNSLQTEMDKKAWETLENHPENKHLVLQEKEAVYYYKSIPIGAPTCLKCHGNKQTDIAAETLKMIDLKYPEDKATAYEMGEFRGMWKIKLD